MRGLIYPKNFCLSVLVLLPPIAGCIKSFNLI
nr:MAG TPA: hypothetical protein [Caudoviricetes sp.]